jgi:hypothetical protein
MPDDVSPTTQSQVPEPPVVALAPAGLVAWLREASEYAEEHEETAPSDLEKGDDFPLETAGFDPCEFQLVNGNDVKVVFARFWERIRYEDWRRGARPTRYYAIKVYSNEDILSRHMAIHCEFRGGKDFAFYALSKLAPSLLEQDRWGNWVISKEYKAAMLAEAVCKLEGFTYAPSDSVYWRHGHSTERDFIYVTTQALNHDQLEQLSDEVGPERTLLVMCCAFRGRREGYPNLTVKKIPKAVLTRCEWGKDDYSLKVENLPKAPPRPGQMELL